MMNLKIKGKALNPKNLSSKGKLRKLLLNKKIINYQNSNIIIKDGILLKKIKRMKTNHLNEIPKNNFSNLKKSYRLNVKNIILFYDNSSIKYSYMNYMKHFIKKMNIDSAGFSYEHFGDKNIVKIFLHFSKLKIINPKFDLDILIDNK